MRFLFILLILSGAAQADVTGRITTYRPTVAQCGKTDGITASGHKLRYGMVAADWRHYPPGTILRLSYSYQRKTSRGNYSRDKKHYSEIMVVADKGGAIKGKCKLDVGYGKISYPKNTIISVVKLGDKTKKPYKAVKQALEYRKVIINEKASKTTIRSEVQDFYKEQYSSTGRGIPSLFPRNNCYMWETFFHYRQPTISSADQWRRISNILMLSDISNYF